MIGHLLRRLVVLVALTLGFVVLVIALVMLGAAVPTRPAMALAASLAVLILGLSAYQPTLLPLVSMATLLVVYRVYLPGVDLSLSDLLLFLAFWPALVFARRGYSREMRTLLWLVVIYQVSTLFTVIANPYLDNTVNWAHSGLLTAGALVIGWAIGRQGQARLGLTLLLVVGGVLAVSTIVQGVLQYAGGDFSAVYTSWPYPMHKNFVGGTLAAVAVIAYVHPPWMGWSRGAALTLFWLCPAAILLAQSRQAIIALGVTLLFIVLRRDPERSRSKLVLATLPPSVILVAITVRDQLESGNRFSSVSQRFTWFQDGLEVWQTSPIFGVGLRWWYTDRFDTRFHPPNAEMEVLTTAGMVGLLGFLALMIGTLATLARLDPRYGTLAVAIVLNRFVQGQLDLFWVSVGVSVPFLVAGICLGAQALYAAEERPSMRAAAARAERAEPAQVGPG
jgi:polysaccharide biosynthesis protein PslJ